MTRAEIEAIGETLRTLGLDVSDGDVAMATLDLDVDAIRAEVAGAVRWEVWDKREPINGVPADTIIRARNDIAEADQVYLVLVGEVITYIQPHVPSVEGIQHMTDADVPAVADAHVADIVAALAFQAIVDDVRERLRPTAPLPLPTPAQADLPTLPSQAQPGRRREPG